MSLSYLPTGRVSPASNKRRGAPDSDDMSTGALIVTPPTSSASPSPTPSLVNSLTDLTMGGQMTVVMQTQREWHNQNVPLEQRWQRAITAVRYNTMVANNGLEVTASEAVLQCQRDVASDTLYIGLHPLKTWVRDNVHRVLVPPTDPQARRISQLVPPNTFCVTIAPVGSGVRSYLQSVCAELRIDFFCVGGSYFEIEMLPDLLDEARKSRRALVLFDHTNWFTHTNYPEKGAAFAHHLNAAMKGEEARQAQDSVANGPHMVLSNVMRRSTPGMLFPNLWIVISSSDADVVQPILELATGASFRMNIASRETALSVARIHLDKRLTEYGYEAGDIEHTLSQTAYRAELAAIADILQRAEVGAILGILDVACQLAFNRDRLTPLHPTVAVNLLPKSRDVRQAQEQLSGQALGGCAAVMAIAPQSMAAEAARMINGGQRK